MTFMPTWTLTGSHEEDASADGHECDVQIVGVYLQSPVEIYVLWFQRKLTAVSKYTRQWQPVLTIKCQHLLGPNLIPSIHI